MGAGLPYILIEAGRVGELDYNVYPDRAFWRYYFAGQALAGLTSDLPAIVNSLGEIGAPLHQTTIAAAAVAHADALLAKLEGEEEGDDVR